MNCEFFVILIFGSQTYIFICLIFESAKVIFKAGDSLRSFTLGLNDMPMHPTFKGSFFVEIIDSHFPLFLNNPIGFVVIYKACRFY